MKKIFTLLMVAVVITANAQKEDIVAWTFPTDQLSDTIADISNTANANSYITTVCGVSDITMKNGATTKAAQATEWENGVGSKAWQVMINTEGYEDILLSSKQTSGGNDPGPRDFKVQYKIAPGGTWTDVLNSEVEVQNDWTTGVLIDLALPAECNNETEVFIRWVVTSNLDINGDDLQASGKAKIDDIYFAGTASSGMSEGLNPRFKMYPNPCYEHLNVEMTKNISNISVSDISGRVIIQKTPNRKDIQLDLANLENGVYFIVINNQSSHKFIIK